MQFYEITFVLRPDLNPQEVENLTEEMMSIAKAEGATIVKQENWGLRKLAYPINKAVKAHYVFFGIQSSAAGLKELERRLSINENVIRQLTVKVEAISKEPSAPIRQDDEREFEMAS